MTPRGGPPYPGRSRCAPLLPLVLVAVVALARAQEQKCVNPVATCDPADDQFGSSDRISITFANKTVPSVVYANTYVDVTVAFNNGTQTVQRAYRFVRCGCQPPADNGARIVLFTDPQALYIDEGPTLAMLSELNEDLSVLKYVPSAQFIFNPDVRARIREGTTKNTNFNLSVLAEDSSISAAIVGSFGMASFEKEREEDARLPQPFIVAEVDEASPLARAEWIKVVGLYLNKASAANTLFANIQSNYNNLKAEAAKALRRPSVFFNSPLKNSTATPSQPLDVKFQWFQPDGSQYITDFLRDANGDYRYATRTDGRSISNNISTTIKDFGSARVLLNAAFFPARLDVPLKNWTEFLGDAALTAELLKLHAVRCEQVYANMKRISSDGQANDFFESAIVRPDKLLGDYVKVLHPNIELNHTLTYMYRYGAPAAGVNLTCPHTDLLERQPQTGRVFLDYALEVTRLDRFQIQDRLEGSVYPELSERDVAASDVDVQFREAGGGSSGTNVTVRRSVAADAVDEARNSSSVREAFQAALGTSVRQINVTTTGSVTTNSGDDGDDGGLSTGGSVGIIISVAVVLAVIIGAFLFTRKRSRRVEGEEPLESEEPGEVQAPIVGESTAEA